LAQKQASEETGREESKQILWVFFQIFQVEKDFKSKEYFQLGISVTLIAEVIDLNLLLFRLCSIWQVLSAFFRLFIDWAEINFC
jgi:hypothetical protein